MKSKISLLYFMGFFLLCYFGIIYHLMGDQSIGIGDSPTPKVIEVDREYVFVVNRRRTRHLLLEQRNRDWDLPKFPEVKDERLQTSYIIEAHEVLRKGLQGFLVLKDTDLGTFMRYLIFNRTEPFVDEYGENIRNYKKVFRFIWEQYNETLAQNYAIKQFNKDKLDLCSVARYLSHQPTVRHRETIMKRMGDALKYRCHPCTPYTPKQYDETIIPVTDDINPDGVSPEESLILCNRTLKKIQPNLNSSYTIKVQSECTLVVEDFESKSSEIADAHEVLLKGFQDLLGLNDTGDLGTYLSYLIYTRTEPFVNEYGQVIRNYRKVFRFVWEQYNDTLVQKYTNKRFKKDRLYLCSIARYLSHQQVVEHRRTIMKRMGDALKYRCHPCTPYTSKQYDETIVPSTDDINPDISPEESLIFCNGNINQRLSTLPITTTDSPIEFTTTPFTIGDTFESSSTTTAELIKPRNPSFSYAPCDFSSGDVVCDQVTLQEVQRVFRQTRLPSLKSVKLVLQPFNFTETFLPEDFLWNKRTLRLRIEFPDGLTYFNGSLRVGVDPNAFRSTKSYTKTLNLNRMDCFLLDFNFLSEFDKLSELFLTNIRNIQMCLQSLPSLPSLTILVIEYSTEMNELYYFPVLKNGLKVAKFVGSSLPPEISMTDLTVNRIMDWILTYSENTMEALEISNMAQVTQVPRHIPSFKALRKLVLHSNNISSIKNGSLYFTAPVSLLNIKENGIRDIEPNGFQGIFADALVFVSISNFSSVKESVFGPILQKMVSGTGYITFLPDRDPVDCSKDSICHLVWLNRYIENAGLDWNLCSNATFFTELLKAGFDHCSLTAH